MGLFHPHLQKPARYHFHRLCSLHPILFLMLATKQHQSQHPHLSNRLISFLLQILQQHAWLTLLPELAWPILPAFSLHGTRQLHQRQLIQQTFLPHLRQCP